MPTIAESTDVRPVPVTFPAAYTNGRGRQELDNEDFLYPDSDGKPMADNTKQFRCIVTIKENIEAMYAGREDVFVAGDLLWYPVKGNPRLSAAPDTMVAFGRPRGDRGSYKQWEENDIAPQVVFEVLSPGNSVREMTAKALFYNLYGVREYYIYDPDELTFEVMIRDVESNHLEPVVTQPTFVSPLLGVRFESGPGQELTMYRPDGERFRGFQELQIERDAAQAERDRAEAERNKAQAERDRATAERDAAQSERDIERQRANDAQTQRDSQRNRAEKLLAQLRAAGLEPEA